MAALTVPETGAKAQTLDDVMLAMDVVDTLRHQQDVVERELGQADRDAELMNRLREIYRTQGIEVSDSVLVEGVKALKESRFVYTPPGPGLGRSLAMLWVRRHRIGTWTLGIAAALAIGWGTWYFGFALPERQAAERARIELSELLPRALEAGHADSVAAATTDAGRTRAAAILSDGQAALRRGDAAGARRAIGDLEALRAELVREYAIRIVARPGEPSGVWREPDRNRRARNFYVIVEAVAPDGQVIQLPVLNEETGRTETVSKWGVRVSEQVFQSVARDKNDDGIIQRNRLGTKQRGALEVEYAMPVQGGAITQW